MGEIGIDKILLIMTVVLLLFGAKRIPEIGSSLGRGIRDFKRSLNDLQSDVHTDLNPPPRDLRAPAAPRDLRTPAPPRDVASTPGQDDNYSGPKRLLT
jgi:sec-independent protein translocase protein TatA